MRLTIIPDIIFRGEVIDYGDFDDAFSRGRVSIRTFRLVPDTPINIDINVNPREPIMNIRRRYTQIVRDELLQRTKDALQVGFDNDIGIFTGDNNSPPILIKKPKDWESSSSVQNIFTTSKTKATFNVIKRNGRKLESQFGKERVWYLSAPQLNNNIDFWKHNDETLSCGYDYIVSNFGDKNGLKKIAKNKQAVDKAINNPTKEHKLIYEEWEKEYSDVKGDDSEFYTLPEYIDTNEIEQREWYKVNCIDLTKSTWSEKDIEKSLCILDIVKWCIVGKVRLNVIDHDNNFYLTYNPEQYKDKYSKGIRTRHNISMIVKYNHAYFITDDKLKKSLSMRDTNFKLEDPTFKKTEQKENLEDKQKTEIDKIQIAEQDYIIRPQVPPTPEELIELTNGEITTNYYIDKSRLNGLVGYLFRYYKLTPDNIINQNRTTIDKVVYNKLNIYSNKKNPPNLEYLDTNRDDYYGKFGRLIEIYPDLNKAYIPSDTEIAQTIYDDIATEDIMSMFNSNTRKLFFNCEIKPDNRKLRKPEYDDNPIISFDFRRAYTTALKYNEYNYCVFDAVNHPVKYRGDFRPDRFYICKNLDRKLRGGYGKRMLYHGVLIQYIMDKVEILSVIEPIKEIPKRYFDKFLERIYELENYYGDGLLEDKINLLENITTSKALVNNFIGSMKRKEGINNYKSWLIDNKETALRELTRNNVPIKLDDNCSWRNECMMISKAKHIIHFQSAQPIRLQIMETINAQNLKLIQHYKVCLYQLKFIHNYQNDIKQRKILSKIRNKKSTIPKNKKFKDIDYEPKVQSIKTDAVYFRSPFKSECIRKTDYIDFKQVERKEWKNSEGMMKFIKYVVDSFNQKSNWTIVNENIMESYEYKEYVKEYKEQIPVVLAKNNWNTDIDIKHKWDKDIGGELLLNHAIYNDGCWISGLGGRGKSELIIGLDKKVAKNIIMKRWVKLICKALEKPTKQTREIIDDFKYNNPTKIKKLAPTNIASNRIEGKTLHRGLGLPIFTNEQAEEEGEDEIENFSGFMYRVISRLDSYKLEDGSWSERCDLLVVDELSMVGGYILSILAYIKLKIPTIKFILMGDLEHQLKPVGEEHRNFINSLVIKELVNYNKLTLHFNFRTGKINDELYEICRDAPHTLNKVGLTTKRNLCYTHKKRKQIIDYHQNKIQNPIINIQTKDTKTGHNDRFILEEGTPIIARKSNKEKQIYKNEIYYFDELVDEKIKIHNERIEVELENIDELKNIFCSAYCITIHKSQSQTYRDEYTIHEWKYISQRTDNFLRLRYTAMSRSDDYENKVYTRDN